MKWLIAAASIIAVWCQQVQCPDGYTAPPASIFTGYCYKYTPDTLTWNAHEVACSQTTLNGQPYPGGHLATLFNQNSATVVMNNYCNGLNQGQSHYFIGYYCISSSYTSRPDWRWSSGQSTAWIHSSPTYLSGAEPDDAGCGRAHYSDDGSNTGRIGDWACSSPLSGGCCEAPVVPTPSPTQTPSNTPTATATQTSTRTATATLTGTGTYTQTTTASSSQTAAATLTRTGTRTASETHTSSKTATATNTATATETATSTESASVSPTASVSTSASPSTSISSSQSPSATETASPSISTSITRTPRPIAIAALGDQSLDSVSVESTTLGVGAGPDTSIEEAQATNSKVVSIAVGAGVAAFLAALCCTLLFCTLRRRRHLREQKARSHLGIQQKLVRQKSAATVAATLGVAKRIAAPSGMRSMLNTMNPALIQVGGERRTITGPRMSIALAAYRSPTTFKPMPTSRLDQAELMSEQEDNQDEMIGIHEEEAAEGQSPEEPIEEETIEESNEETDEVIDEEDIAHITPTPVHSNRIANPTPTYSQKTKKPIEQAAEPPTELKQIVIGKGALFQERVEKQTIQLRRVSKIKGDKELSATRSRPSMFMRSGYGPQSSRNLLNPYEFTATVARTIVKKEDEA